MSPKPSSSPLNIPSGNSPITPDAQPSREEDRQTGDRWRDIKTILSRIDIKQEFQNLDKIPCIRNSLLYGIGGGTGIGAIRFLGTRRPRAAFHWALGSFLVIAPFQWESCRRARLKELQQMRVIQEKFPHRHASKLIRAGGTGEPPDAAR